jgi:putative acetyltransferase
MLIREEAARDRAQIRAVNESAFKRPDEADLVDRLRAEGVVLVSLVAEVDGEIAGHILFTRMTIEAKSGSVEAVALAPMAVLPRNQRQGIGSELVRQGLGRLRAMEERIVIVVGHPDYYPRFGFSCDKASSLASPFPREVLMALELVPGSLTGIEGPVRYAAAFGL